MITKTFPKSDILNTELAKQHFNVYRKNGPVENGARRDGGVLIAINKKWNSICNKNGKKVKFAMECIIT